MKNKENNRPVRIEEEELSKIKGVISYPVPPIPLPEIKYPDK